MSSSLTVLHVRLAETEPNRKYNQQVLEQLQHGAKQTYPDTRLTWVPGPIIPRSVSGSKNDSLRANLRYQCVIYRLQIMICKLQIKPQIMICICVAVIECLQVDLQSDLQ